MDRRTVVHRVSLRASRPLQRLTFTAIALVAATPSLMAAAVKVGSVSINLPPPAGFCELSSSNPTDKSMLDSLADDLSRGGNNLLSVSADCDQLAAWRTGKQLLDDFSQYQTTRAEMAASSDAPTPIARTCALLRAQGEKLNADAKSRVDSVYKKMKVNSSAFIGVLAEEPTACYAGQMFKGQTDAGTDKTTLILFALTIVKGKTIFAYRFATYTGSGMVTDTLAKLKDNVAALYAANQ